MSTTFSTRFSAVMAMPSTIGVRASPAERRAPLSMKKMSIPLLNRNITRRNGSASAFTAGAAFTRSSRYGREKVPRGRHDPQRDADGGQERLVDGAVHLLLVAGAHEARHQHAHPR